MSGPGLAQVDSHAAIHEAAVLEAIELNDMLAKLLHNKQKEKALEVAYVAVEHWESRTLKHADAEERGLYKRLTKISTTLKESVIELTRDHNLMRILVHEIKEMLDESGMDEQVLEKFYTLVHVDLIHNRDEEKVIAEAQLDP